MLATTADRPQLTLAHTATFHPGRAEEEEEEERSRNGRVKMGEEEMGRGGTVIIRKMRVVVSLTI